MQGSQEGEDVHLANLASVFYSCAKLYHRDDALFSTLFAAIRSSVNPDSVDPKHLVQMVAAAAKLGHPASVTDVEWIQSAVMA